MSASLAYLNPSVQEPWWLSVNHLKEWEKCPKQFYYKTVLKQRCISDERNFELGKTVHALMDLQAKGLPYTHLETGLSPKIRSHFQALREHPLAKAPTLASEYAFYVPFQSAGLPPIFLTGRVDRISEVQGRLALIDWKTGTAVPPDYPNAWQTRLYAYAIWRLLQANPHAFGDSRRIKELSLPFMFYYVEVRLNRTPPVKDYAVEMDATYLAETEALLTQQIQKILAERHFPLPKACPDRYCPFNRVCGIEPKTESPLWGLPEALVLEPQHATMGDPFDLF